MELKILVGEKYNQQLNSDTKVLHTVQQDYRKNRNASSKRKGRKWMSKNTAAIIIQQAFRNYRRRKLVNKLNKGVVMRFRPGNMKRKPKNEKVLKMFSIPKKTMFTLTKNSDAFFKPAYKPPGQHLLTNMSLFQQDRETVLIFGGVDPHNDYGVGRNTGKNIYQYSANENTWEFVGELPEPRNHHSTQFLKGRIFLVGGSDPREDELKGKCTILDTMWSFDPVSKNWFSEPCLQEGRKNFGLIAFNHSLYAIGGQGTKYESLRSVEKFNMEEKLWEMRAPMKHSRIGPACAKYKNCIWVAGGLSGTKNKRNLLDSLESYNLKNNQWCEIKKPLRFPRCFSRMFSLNDRLYLIGGAGKTNEDENNEINSIGDIDIWDPKNIQWKNVTELHIPRHGHAVAYLGTQILVVGGVTTTYKRALSNTECFCSQRGTLVRGLACLPTGLSGHSSVTLPPASLLAS